LQLKWVNLLSNPHLNDKSNDNNNNNNNNNWPYWTLKEDFDYKKGVNQLESIWTVANLAFEIEQQVLNKSPNIKISIYPKEHTIMCGIDPKIYLCLRQDPLDFLECWYQNRIQAQQKEFAKIEKYPSFRRWKNILQLEKYSFYDAHKLTEKKID